jgi:hypothetical protein
VDTNCPFQFQKRRQDFIRTHHEMLAVVAMRVSNPDCPPLTINGRNASPTPSGFAEIVSDAPNPSRTPDLRLLFLAEFLESGVAAQRVPEWVESQKRRRNHNWRRKKGDIIGRF